MAMKIEAGISSSLEMCCLTFCAERWPGPVTKRDFRKKPEMGIYMNSLLTRKITVPFKHIGQNIKDVIKKSISKDILAECENLGLKNSKELTTITLGYLAIIFNRFMSYNNNLNL